MTSQQNIKIPTDWDVDVIDYWNASLSSYKKHHENPDKEVDSDTVTSEFIDSLPVRQKQQIAETEPVIPQATNNKSSVKRKATTQENKVTQESQIGAWSYVNNNDVEEEYEEEDIPSKEYNDQQQEEEYYYYNNEEQEYIGDEEPSAKKPRYNHEQPPPPPGLPQDNEALSNLIMAWYYAGYYTGLYQAGGNSNNRR